MKNAIIMVSMLSAAILAVVLMLSFAKENGLTDTDYTNVSSSDETPSIIIPSFSIYIETTTMKFWDRIAALNSTAPQFTEVTDENGEAVLDENGNIVTELISAPVTDIPAETDVSAPVTPSTEK